MRVFACKVGKGVLCIRKATTVTANQPDSILAATRELLEAILDANSDMCPEDVASAIFTFTEDLCATFPAQGLFEQ